MDRFTRFSYCATFAAVEVSGEKAIASVQGGTSAQKSIRPCQNIGKFPQFPQIEKIIVSFFLSS